MQWSVFIIILSVHICSLMYQTFDEVSSVVRCCIMKSFQTTPITHIHRHSFSQQPINCYDVTTHRCTKEALNELPIGFWVWKTIAFKLKRNNLIFANTHFHETYFNCLNFCCKWKTNRYHEKLTERTQFFRNFDTEIQFSSNKNEKSKSGHFAV